MMPPPLSRRFALRTAVRTALSWGLAAPLGFGLSAQAVAQEDKRMYEGQAFLQRIRLFGVDLQLNGTGVRQVAWFKGYLVALYLSTVARTADQVVAAPGPKRVQLRLLYDVPAAEFSKAVKKGLTRNVAESLRPPLLERLDRFAKQIDALGTVRKKDVIDLDFDPARGLLLYVNATLRGDAVPGEDFYAALLRSFVGDDPYDQKMRDGLLGKLA